jgi:hypothetical protein
MAASSSCSSAFGATDKLIGSFDDHSVEPVSFEHRWLDGVSVRQTIRPRPSAGVLVTFAPRARLIYGAARAAELGDASSLCWRVINPLVGGRG